MSRACLVLGCGSIGTRRARLLRILGHETYLFDVDEDKTAAVGWGTIPGLPGADVDITAVFICTPADSDRAFQIRSAMEYNPKGIFVEKPVATTPKQLDEIEHLYAEAFSRNIVTMGACNMRFAKTLWNGRPIATQTGNWTDAHFVMRQAAHLWSPAHRPISLALDSIHEIDLATYMLGPASSVVGQSSLDECRAVIGHAGGARSLIEMDRTTDPPLRYVMLKSRDGEMYRVDYDTLDMYAHEMEHFLNACADPHVRNTNPLNEAVRTCRVALEIIQS